jgi:phospholipid/cholesterol/gamma-HCH transport system substrate-binding protein
MSPKNSNFVIGVSVLAFLAVGLTIIGWMTLNFRGGPRLTFFRKFYEVRIGLESLEGVSEGTDIRLNGKRIGIVRETEVDPSADPPATALAEVRHAFPIPRDARARLVVPMFGRPYLEVVYSGRPTEYWPTDGTTLVRLEGTTRPNAFDKVGDAVGDLKVEMDRTVREATKVLANMNAVIEENRKAIQLSIAGIEKMVGSPENRAALSRALAFAGSDKLHADIAKSVEGVRSFTADEKFQADIKAAAADIRAVAADFKDISARVKDTSAKLDTLLENADQQLAGLSQRADRIGGHVEAAAKELPEQLKLLTARTVEDLERLNSVLGSLDRIAKGLERGEGTAGMLLRDPRLYEAMLDLLRTAQMIGDDMRKLVKKWDEGGVKLRL